MELTRRDFTIFGAAAIALPAHAATDEKPWRQLPTEPYKGKQDDVSFVDADHGWYGNGQGKLYRTVDGGLSWSKVRDQPGTFIRALGFVDAQTGYIGNVGVDYYPGVTDRQPLYRTNDGGVSWTAVTAPGIEAVAGICGIDILPVQRIFQGEMRTTHIITAGGRVGGPAMLIRSDDDGASWRVLDLTKQAGMILDVKFHDARTGFVCASGVSPEGEGDALILMTRDGGQSWKPVWRSGRKLENCWKMYWPSRRVGYATVQSYDPSNLRRTVIKTTDGGASWKELLLAEVPGLQQFGIGFIDEKRGWVGTNKTGYETRDGGKHWMPVELGKAVNKFRVLPLPDGKKRVFALGSTLHRLDL